MLSSGPDNIRSGEMTQRERMNYLVRRTREAIEKGRHEEAVRLFEILETFDVFAGAKRGSKAYNWRLGRHEGDFVEHDKAFTEFEAAINHIKQKQQN